MTKVVRVTTRAVIGTGSDVALHVAAVGVLSAWHPLTASRPHSTGCLNGSQVGNQASARRRTSVDVHGIRTARDLHQRTSTDMVDKFPRSLNLQVRGSNRFESLAAHPCAGL